MIGGGEGAAAASCWGSHFAESELMVLSWLSHRALRDLNYFLLLLKKIKITADKNIYIFIYNFAGFRHILLFCLCMVKTIAFFPPNNDNNEVPSITSHATLYML